MALWVWITLGAAFLQNARSAMQKSLKGRVGPTGAVFVRFGYGAPFALLYLGALVAGGRAIPDPSLAWAGWLTAGAVAQILATAALLASFSHGNFAVGTAFSKTEPIQTAIFGAVLLGDGVTPLTAAAIAVGVVGVLLATSRPGPGAPRFGLSLGAGAALGLTAAALFGVSAVGYRAASLALPEGDFLIRAAATLAAATLLQTALMLAWMAWRARDEIVASAAAWRPGLLTGLFGAGASAGWFTAMTLEPAAHVRALAQVELLFTFAASAFIFRERPTRRDLAGAGLIALGAVMLLIGVGV